MKRFVFFAITTLLMGCTATQYYGNSEEMAPIDLTSDTELVNDYWVLSKRVNPNYPVKAAKKGLNGCVNFELVIDSEGKPRNIKVIKAVPEVLFVSEGKKALKQNRWSPTESNVSKQPVLMTLQWDFQLYGVPGMPDCKVNGA